MLSHKDLEKADEFFEATARHLLDKFEQMVHKYQYLLLMESQVIMEHYIIYLFVFFRSAV
jgi:hypothetical protein